MRSIALFAVITALSTGVWCGRAEAMPLAAPGKIAAGITALPLQRVASICGLSGCSPVWTKKIQKPPAGFAKRAAPIVVQAHQVQNAAPLAPVK